ncbi:MAG: formate/nitrite transporter family protein [Oscillospiraceae bacterium]|nr:formate/nitrite transporter family protein [Oscillospiraceae bacterium]
MLKKINNKLLLHFVDLFLKSSFAGIIVSIAGIVYINNRDIWGSIFFSVGLVSILKLRLKLFTGIAGFDNNYQNLLICFCGNLVGTICGSLIFKDKIRNFDFLNDLVQNKIDSNILTVFFSAIACGVFIYTAVLSYKNNCNDILSVVFCVSMFVIFGADHCIANSFFYFASKNLSFGAILNILICTIGNFLGAVLCDFISSFARNQNV